MKMLSIKKYKIYLFILFGLIFVAAFAYSVISYLHSLRSFEVVIARYNENLDWVNKNFPNEKIIIYNKGKNDFTPLPNWKIIELPNIGRESHTYLYHIVANYNNLADRTLFLQGNSYGHIAFLYHPLIRYKLLLPDWFNKCKNITAKCVDIDLNGVLENNRKSTLSNISYSVYLALRNYPGISFKDNNNENGLKKFTDEVLDRKLSDDTMIYITYGAQFAVDKEAMLLHSKEYYQRILNTLYSLSPVEGYYIERLWDVIFDDGKYKDVDEVK